MRKLLPTAYCLLLRPRPRSRARAGQTALSMVFVLGGIIVLFATTLSFLALSFLNSTYGFQAANKAEAMAQGGVNDAMLQLERNPTFSSTGYCVPITSGGGTPPCPLNSALVVVTQGTPTVGQVTATGDITMSGYRRKIQQTYSVTASTSLVQLLTSQELTF